MPQCAQCGGPITGSGYAGRSGAAYCCYGCLALGERDCNASCSPAPEMRGVGVRLGVAILVVGQSMIFGLALNLHDDVPPAARAFTQWMILGGTVLVAALLGGPLVRTAWAELRRGRLTIEALFLLTAAGAMAASLQAHLTGRGKIYFEVVSVLLVVYTLGKLIGARSRVAALAASRAWGDRLGACRLVDDSGSTRTVKVAEVRPGDVVEVHPGELVAVDGVVREGGGFVSESAVSGEPFAVVRRPGDRVLAGSASFDATFRIEATAPGTAREIDRLLAAVEAAREQPLSLQSRADALGRWFLPLVVAVAVGTFLYWTFLTNAGWEAALFHAMSVLLVACPCVIGLATPVVIWSAISRLAERGVIVRGGDAVERLAGVDRVMLDKTGTLTDDRFALVDIESSAEGDELAKLLGWLSLVQSQSSHPVAKPFAELPRSFAPGAGPRVRSLVAVPGRGVVAELEEPNGARHEMKVGTAAWLASHSNAPFSREPKASAHTVCVALDGKLVAVATVAERLRDSTPQALAHFAALGLPVEVLTGDAPGRAEALGLPPARGGLLPDDKRAAVEAAKAAGARPLFVGDGINDASALAAAHCGIALAGGTDLAVSAAPVTLYHADLRAIPWAVELARDAARAVRRNLLRALCYNLVGMALAACGVLHPVVAALLMVLSSLTLIFSSTRVGHCVGEEAKSQTPSWREEDQEGMWNRATTLGVGFSVVATGDTAAPAGPPLNPSSAQVSEREDATHSPSLKGGGRGVGLRALAHALAFVLQGVAFLLLVESLRKPPAALPLLGAFALIGAGLAFAWRRFALPHAIDMCVGMLTLGNLGMLLGWWADAGFAPLHDGGCCACVEAVRSGMLKPWMWVGMLLGGNAAMLWLGRGPVPGGGHARAMFTGGNAGMLLGMAAGGWLAAQANVGSVAAAVALGYAGMTAGMLAGMLAGTWLAERFGAGLAAVGLVPRLRVTTSRTP